MRGTPSTPPTFVSTSGGSPSHPAAPTGPGRVRPGAGSSAFRRESVSVVRGRRWASFAGLGLGIPILLLALLNYGA